MTLQAGATWVRPGRGYLGPLRLHKKQRAQRPGASSLALHPKQMYIFTKAMNVLELQNQKVFKTTKSNIAHRKPARPFGGLCPLLQSKTLKKIGGIVPEKHIS